MEHSVHLAAGHFITTVSPTSSRRLLNKIRKAYKKAQPNDNVDEELAELDEEDGDEGDEGDKDGEDEEGTNFDLSDTIGKALALVKQVLCFLYCAVIFP
jgi:hypothetical protein